MNAHQRRVARRRIAQVMDDLGSSLIEKVNVELPRGRAPLSTPWQYHGARFEVRVGRGRMVARPQWRLIDGAFSLRVVGPSGRVLWWPAL